MIQIDVIGTLYTDPVMDGTQVVTPGEPLPGYHINATHAVTGWDAWRVTPAQPRRVFGGGVAVFYTFTDQAAYEAARLTADLTIPPPAPTVPDAVTMRQARLVLLAMGKLAAVDAALNGLPEPQRSAAKIEWEYSSELHRNKALVQALAPALGLTDAQLDQAFIAAAQID